MTPGARGGVLQVLRVELVERPAVELSRELRERLAVDAGARGRQVRRGQEGVDRALPAVENRWSRGRVSGR
jgi:hypothetical protein